MTSFSTDWLRLREPADHRARNREITAKAAGLFEGRPAVTVMDFGCGLGSTVRALAPLLPAAQTWRLVDHDPDLLAAAEQALADWADHVESRAPLIVRKEGRRLTIATERADLAQEFPSFKGIDFVTTSAFLDLVSATWLSSAVEAFKTACLPVLAALTYDGDTHWTLRHPLDEAMRRALNEHQQRDKGLGLAMGPDAAETTAGLFARFGYEVERGASPWRIDRTEARLGIELADGFVTAARELGGFAEGDLADWLEFRKRAAEGDGETFVGHDDMVAFLA